MKNAARFALAAAVLLAPVPGFAGAAGRVEVSFVAPETFTDAAHRRGASRELGRTLAQLEKHFGKLAARLPADQTLKVEITDIDLAGRVEPASVHDIRILRDVYPPRITLRYTLTRNSAPLASGEASLSDLAYLHRMVPGPTGDPLRHEKRLLTDWFRTKIAGAAS